MTTVLWAALLAAAALWPAPLSGPLDGAPLDGRLEAIVLGLALPALIAFDRRLLTRRPMRALIVTLLVWKAVTAATLAADGWCLRLTSPAPLFVNQEQVPHAWDVRADWQADVPRCSAVMTRAYPSILAFPVWFYNLPPNNFNQPAQPSDRPPAVSLDFDLGGHLTNRSAGVLSVAAGADVTVTASIDGFDVDQARLAAGVPVAAGEHLVSVRGRLIGDRWALQPEWNGAALWDGGPAVATMTPAAAADRWFRPWARWVPALLFGALLLMAAGRLTRRVSRSVIVVATAAGSVGALAHALGLGAGMRLAPAAMAAGALLPLPRRVQNMSGACLLIGAPFLALFAARGWPDAGLTTWYTSGDDWWMFQRFAYRIFMQGYWLEGGEPTFWFQPLYRWIAGSLHMIFGDSSIGELFWDAACALTGGLFAFHVTRAIAGFRWGLVAATLALTLLTAGPAWYLFGRGLSELTSAGFIYAGALFALRARHGAPAFVVLAGLCVVGAFYSRLNNLPMALAIAAFALPLRQPAGEWYQPARWWRRVSWPVAFGVGAAMALAALAFAWRTYYYTGEFSMLYGTQAGALSVWQPTDDGQTTGQNVLGSVLMVLTMNDPARWDPRALPLVAGTLAAVAALAGFAPLRRLPMNLSLLCLAAFAGAFVARGSAYPGRFSVHLIPVTVSLTVCAVALFRGSRTAPADPA